MSSYAELAARLQESDDDWEMIGPQPESRVREVEQQLNLQLPQSYRRFLMEVGGLEYPNHYYTGIDDDYLDPDDGFASYTNLLRA